MELNEFKKILGQRVIGVSQFYQGSFNEGFIVKFENGEELTAQDGEYGDNTFIFLTGGKLEVGLHFEEPKVLSSIHVGDIKIDHTKTEEVNGLEAEDIFKRKMPKPCEGICGTCIRFGTNDCVRANEE